MFGIDTHRDPRCVIYERKLKHFWRYPCAITVILDQQWHSKVGWVKWTVRPVRHHFFSFLGLDNTIFFPCDGQHCFLFLLCDGQHCFFFLLWGGQHFFFFYEVDNNSVFFFCVVANTFFSVGVDNTVFCLLWGWTTLFFYRVDNFFFYIWVESSYKFRVHLGYRKLFLATPLLTNQTKPVLWYWHLQAPASRRWRPGWCGSTACTTALTPREHAWCWHTRISRKYLSFILLLYTAPD